MEGVLGLASVGLGIRQRTDDFLKPEHRVRPAMREHQGQGVFVFRARVNEMDVEPVDLGCELRKFVQLALLLAQSNLARQYSTSSLR